MNLCDDRGHFTAGKGTARRRNIAALKDIDAVSFKMRRAACKRMNQRFLNSSLPGLLLPDGYSLANGWQSCQSFP